MYSNIQHTKLNESVIEALANYEVQYNVADWDRMEGLLTKLPTKTSINKSYSTLISVSVGSVIALVILYNIFKSDDAPPVVEKKNVEQEITLLNSTIDSILNIQPVDTITSPDKITITQQQNEKKVERKNRVVIHKKETATNKERKKIAVKKETDPSQQQSPTISASIVLDNIETPPVIIKNDSTKEGFSTIDTAQQAIKEKKKAIPFQKRERKGR